MLRYANANIIFTYACDVVNVFRVDVLFLWHHNCRNRSHSASYAPNCMCTRIRTNAEFRYSQLGTLPCICCFWNELTRGPEQATHIKTHKNGKSQNDNTCWRYVPVWLKVVDGRWITKKTKCEPSWTQHIVSFDLFGSTLNSLRHMRPHVVAVLRPEACMFEIVNRQHVFVNCHAIL